MRAFEVSIYRRETVGFRRRDFRARTVGAFVLVVVDLRRQRNVNRASVKHTHNTRLHIQIQATLTTKSSSS